MNSKTQFEKANCDFSLNKRKLIDGYDEERGEE
jgi:hypothetical protein